MAYIVDQYNQRAVAASSTSSTDNIVYMEQLTPENAEAKRKQNPNNEIFYDECVKGISLSANKTYYLHAKIKKLNSQQNFKLYLSFFNSSVDKRTQFLKNIKIDSATGASQWYDFNIVFTPLADFDCIFFVLDRISEDYVPSTKRYPTIVYEELSIINNMINTKIAENVELLKLATQGRTGLVTCINGEEIHIGKTGVYTLKEGVITTKLFSAINTAIEDPNGSNPLRDPTNPGGAISLTEYLTIVAGLPTETSTINTNSKCIFCNSKLRAIEAFSLDYMYQN